MAKVACLVGPDFEDSELAVPVERLTSEGHQVEIIGLHGGLELSGKEGRVKVLTDAAIFERSPDMYDALLIPGGRSPENLRNDEQVIQFVREFAGTGRPIAAICHGPQLLIDAGVVSGVRMTSGPSVRADLRNAGAEVEDEEVVEDGQFITSRMPEDVEAFARALIQRLHLREQVQKAGSTELAGIHASH